MAEYKSLEDAFTDYLTSEAYSNRNLMDPAGTLLLMYKAGAEFMSEQKDRKFKEWLGNIKTQPGYLKNFLYKCEPAIIGQSIDAAINYQHKELLSEAVRLLTAIDIGLHNGGAKEIDGSAFLEFTMKSDMEIKKVVEDFLDKVKEQKAISSE